MDDVDLPPVPPSARKAASSLPQRPSSFLIRKRTHTDYDNDVATSSDPALFSSDEHAPDAENYVSGKRKKHTYRGSWWEHRRVKVNGQRKREFRRNFDSGVFMGSETSDEALSSDSFGLEDELLRDQQGHHAQPSRLYTIQSVETTPKGKAPSRPTAPPPVREHEEVCRIVKHALDQGQEDVDLSSMFLSTLPSEVSSLQTLSKQAEIVPGMLDVGTDLEAKLRLYLANNLFVQLPTPILDLRNLRVLSLRQNNLSSIPPTIRELVNLESLNIAGNQLQELPFEVLELVRFHSLKHVTVDPNPFLRPMQTREDDSSLVRHEQFNFPADTAIPTLHRRLDLDSTVQATFTGGRLPGLRGVPSLVELVLRKMSQHDPLSQIDFTDYMPPDTPDSILEDLKLLKSQPSRRCTRCHRSIVLAAKQWVEWWKLPNGSPSSGAWGEFAPLTRLLCSENCLGHKNIWCDQNIGMQSDLQV